MTHGYMLSGSGSNIYVQNLCRALVRTGHEIHLLCQEPRPLEYDFVDEYSVVGEAGIELRGKQETAYDGRCIGYLPDIGDLLPVYVYDEYPGWRVKTFLDLTAKEFEEYVRRNIAAIRSVVAAVRPDSVITNHSVPGPLMSRRALEDTGTPYLSIVHGSALQYVARRSAFYKEVAREGLGGAEHILALSADSAGTIVEDFSELEHKIQALPGGVDTSLFRPDALDLDSLQDLRGGAGRGPEQATTLDESLKHSPLTEGDLAVRLNEISASYEPRAHDRDTGDRLKAFLDADTPLVVYVGKLIHSKGVHSLLSAFAPVHRQTGARLLVVGFGTFREGLEALTLAMSSGDRHTLELLTYGGRLYEGAPREALSHFTLSEDLMRDAAGMADAVEFIGPLEHKELAKLLPVADVAVVPSIFPESFGLVAAEAAASGVPPFVADHSGLKEAGGIVGRGLPFDTRVGMDNFENNLAHALTDYFRRTEKERIECGEIVRRNSVEYLGWDTLAGKIAELAG
ncbi:MAG: glycosyltransferase family 4 protein [Rubrobacteraceae bacterium]